MLCGRGGSRYWGGGLQYQREWWIHWKSLCNKLGLSTNYGDYLEDFSQGDKIELDKNNVIYIHGEPITHTIDETFDIQKQKVIDFTDYNHMLVQLVCSVVDGFSIDEQSFNLLKLEFEHVKQYDFIGVDELLSNFFDNTVKINLERSMENVIDPF